MFDDAIEEFWAWWATAREPLAVAIETEAPTDILDELTDQLWRIHPELDWQIAPGTTARHALNLVSGGSRLLRLVAELWRRRGPADDEVWEYHPARQPFKPEPFLVAGLEVDPAAATATAVPDPLYHRLDLTVGHPAFEALGDDDARDVALYLLDAVLGEDEAERWVGLLTTVPEPIGEPIDALADVMADVTGTWETDGWEDVSDQYDGVVDARVDRSVKWIDHLDKPIYAEITIQGLSTDVDGMPVDLERSRLDTLTDELLARLGRLAVPMGVATGDGERSLHLFTSTNPSVSETIDAWIAENPNRAIERELAADEQWAYAEQWD